MSQPPDSLRADEINSERSTAQAGLAENTLVERNSSSAFPNKLHLQFSLEGIPEPISSILKRASEPHKESKLKSIIKDYLPALTPIATAALTFFIGYYGHKVSTQRTREALDKITTEFVASKGSNPEIAAIKLAAYGKDALPAMRMVLAATEDGLRNGGVLIAEKMYVGGTVDREVLVEEIMRDYGNPGMRRGALEWFKKMEGQLSEQETKLAFAKLQTSFQGKECMTQKEMVARAAGDVLLAWSADGSHPMKGEVKQLSLDMAFNCRDAADPSKYLGAREQAVDALKHVASTLPKAEQDSVLCSLDCLRSDAPNELLRDIDNAVVEIKK